MPLARMSPLGDRLVIKDDDARQIMIQGNLHATRRTSSGRRRARGGLQRWTRAREPPQAVSIEPGSGVALIVAATAAIEQHDRWPANGGVAGPLSEPDQGEVGRGSCGETIA
jgi:hypothetical protein